MNLRKKQSFLKQTLRFGLIFLVVFTLIKILIGLFKGGISGMTAQYFGPETWTRFVLSQVVASLFYGLFMAGYYKFFKK